MEKSSADTKPKITPERITLNGDSKDLRETPKALLWSAVVAHADKQSKAGVPFEKRLDVDTLFKTEQRFPLNFDVVFLVNNVQVSFVDVINDWYGRLDTNVEEEIRKRGVQLVDEDFKKMLKGIEDLRNTVMEQVRNKLKYWGEIE